MTPSHQRERQAELKNRFASLMGPPPAAPAEQEQAVAEQETLPVPVEPPAAQPAKKASRARPRSTAPRPPRPAGAEAPSGPAVAPMPVAQTQADTGRPQRLMVPLSVDEDRSLKQYRVDDGVPAAARIRAMLQLYREDERFRRKVDETVRKMR